MVVIPWRVSAGAAGLTLGQFIDESYAPWVRANRPRTAANSLDKLQRHFGTWFAEPLSAITVERLELWKGRRMSGGCKPVTLLRDLFTLSSVLTRAVRMEKLAANPIRKVEKPRIDRGPKVRFLDAAEESRLRFALRARDAQLRLVRTSANRRRMVRRENVLPPLLHFGDHLTPAVLLSMNTGLRLGETLKLRWKNVHLDRRWLTVEGREAKSRQTRHVPLNAEAVTRSDSMARTVRIPGTSLQCHPKFQDSLVASAGARRHTELPLARFTSPLRLATRPSGCTAEYGARSAWTQLGGDVAALCPSRA
jgi:integrase